MSELRETKEMFALIVAFGNAIGKSLVDGKLDLGDLFNLLGVINKIRPAIDNASMIPSEIGEMSEAEAEDLKKFVIQNFSIPQEAAEAFIELALGMSIDLIEAINYFRKKAVA